MNPFSARHKTQGIRSQNPCFMKQTAGVCLQNTSDYSPFGVSLDGRTMESYFYRRGFNGMEKDDEFKGKGNSYTTEFRQLDPRLGRWMTIDPKSNMCPMSSPYCSMANSPILANDIKGDFIPLIIGGVVIAEEIVTALFLSTAVIAVKTSHDIISNTNFSSSFPGPWYTSRGTPHTPSWLTNPKLPNRQTPPNSNNKWVNRIMFSTLTARLVKQIHDQYKDAAKEDNLVMDAKQINVVEDKQNNLIHYKLQIDVKLKVESDDNLTNIAKKYNTTVDQIVKWNNLKDPDLIIVNQMLKIGEFSGKDSSINEIPKETNKATVKDNTRVEILKKE